IPAGSCGRPSIGPVPVPNAGWSRCGVVFALAVGAGFRGLVFISSRGTTSKRGIGCEKGAQSKRGLGGAPVGPIACARALATNGLRPPIGASRPALVKRPHLIKSRREIRPQDNSRTISARFLLAHSASRRRAFEALYGR